MTDPFSPKQIEFIVNSNAKWNLAHGSVRSGKTVCTVFRFLQAALNCPDSKIYIVGHTFDTAYRNVIRLIMESEELSIFRPYCSWSGKKLLFRDKVITVLGAKDEGAVGNFQGDTHSLTYCDEMTLYPESIVDMIDTRLSRDWSMGFAAMNPSHPKHKIKQWIDKAEEGDPNYYALHFSLDDNPFIGHEYKMRVKNSLSGVFFKRNYLGLWCLAEGSVFDFFDPKFHVVDEPPCAADYWVAGIDYGAVNPLACVLVGVSTGRHTQTGRRLWVEKEYYWDPKKTGRQKTNAEFADDIQRFLEPYGVKQLYIDPSAAAFKVDLRRRGIAVVDANNEVLGGIGMMASEIQTGNLVICSECKNLIKEIESYTWDTRQSERGKDAPMKRDDHACVTGDTYVDTTQGKIQISKMLKEKHTIISYNAMQNRYELSEVDGSVLTRKKSKILKMTLENGNILKCTPDHKVYTKRGFIEVQNLLEDDEVLCYYCS